MPTPFHPYDKVLPLRARELRRRMTAPESRLWYSFLKSHPRRFTRQKPLGRFIVDFYCASRQLAIEIDGDSHFDAKAQRYDARRTAALIDTGVRTLRFTNHEVMKNFESVCGKISEAMEDKSPGTPATCPPRLTRG